MLLCGRRRWRRLTGLTLCGLSLCLGGPMQRPVQHRHGHRPLVRLTPLLRQTVVPRRCGLLSGHLLPRDVQQLQLQRTEL